MGEAYQRVSLAMDNESWAGDFIDKIYVSKAIVYNIGGYFSSLIMNYVSY